MPTREQKQQAARLRGETRAAVINTIRCGGTPEAIADEALRQIDLRYNLVAKAADGPCPVHPFITRLGGVCGMCGPARDDEPEEP